MKQYKILSILSALCILFCASCADYEDPAIYTPSVTTGQVDASSITRTEGTLTGTIISPDAKTIKSAGFRYSIYESMEVATEVKTVLEGQSIKAPLSHLETGKTYYYYAFASGGFNEVRGQVQSFTTKQYEAPRLSKISVSDIGKTSANASATLLDNGGGALSAAGFVYRVSSSSEPAPMPSNTSKDWQLVSCKDFANISNNVDFTELIENLEPDTEYAISAFATNKTSSLTGYSEVIRFRTLEQNINGSTKARIGGITLSDITETSVLATASIIDDGNSGIVISGFCLSPTNTLPDLSDQVIFSSSGADATISATINSLTKNSTYYLRAFVTNTVGTSYSDVKEFQTANYVAPMVDIVSLLNVDFTEMTVSSKVSDNGGINVTECGFCYSMYNNLSTLEDKHVSASLSNTGFQTTIKNLKPNRTYYVRAYAINERGTGYSTTALEVTTPSNGYDPSAGHVFVDLGLKDAEGNTVCWATCNVGAETPEDYGDYFAWGEIEPKSIYNFSTYKWCNGTKDSITKYVDGKTILDPEDDAATQNWGGDWRMPTSGELYWLQDSNNCTWTWDSAKNGYTVTSKTTGASIFLPSAGYRIDSRLSSAGSLGLYWSSSPDSSGAYYLYFSSSYRYVSYYDRCYGQSVRPVCVFSE